MRRFTFLLIAGLCALTPSSIVIAQSPTLTPFRGLIDHVSVDQWGGTYAGADIWHHAISGDGRYVVFNSSSDMVPNDNDYNGVDDIFLRDRATGTTSRVSMAPDGGPGNGISQYGTISSDGRFAAFASGSSNLVAGDTNDHWDVFVRDLTQQTTVRISVATDGTQGDRDSYYPSLSADGRFVAFLSWATTFASGVSQSSPRQVYLHDRDADADGIFDEPGEETTELMSVGFSGGIADHSVDTPHVSTDGRVLFESDSTNLSDVGNSNGMNHLYLRDRSTSQTTLIDRAVTGGPSAWGVYYGTSDMSDDGRYITFPSISQDIVWLDMNWQSQIFLYDTVAGPTATQIVTQLPNGTNADGSSYATSVSGDGRYVVFTTAASNLATPPTGASGPAMLVVRDMLDGSFRRVDVLDNGDAFDQADYYMSPAVSADGTTIVLSSRSNNALPNGYGFGAMHVFALTAFGASPESATFPMEGGTGSIDVDTSSGSGWSASTYDSWILVLDGGYSAGPRTVHYEVTNNYSGIARNGSIRVGSKTIAIHQDGDGDTTPPVITPVVTGTQVNGWYTTDITVSFTVSDPDSEIVNLSYGCTQTFTYTTDFLYAAPQCEATSHGGTATVTVPLRRDTTPPMIVISEPKATIYPYGAITYPNYSCSDSYSGATNCTGPNLGSPLDTWTRGRNVFTVTSTDEVGNTATKTVEYIVGTDQCVSLPSVPANLTRWFTFDGTLHDGIGNLDAVGQFAPGVFQNGIAQQAWANDQPWNALWAGDAQSVLAGPSGLTVAMWVKPQGVFYPYPEYETLVFNPMQYHFARWIDGTLRWAFNTTNGFTWVNTGVPLWTNSWYHVAVTYHDGVVETYVNGSLAHTQALNGTLITGPNTAGLQIAGSNSSNHSLHGILDDVMIFDTALSASDVDALALAGGGSLCAPLQSNLTVSAPQTIVFGNAFAVAATLTDGSGRPLRYREVTLRSAVSPSTYVYENVQLDANGSVVVSFPISSDVPIGEYPDAITADFAGDGTFAAAQAQTGVTLLPGTPLVYWQPEPLTYGTPLGAAQQNAVSMPGTYVYSPASGTLLGAGPRTISVTITPDDPHWAQTTVWRTIVVSKATPTIEMPTISPVYNGQPQAATPTVRGVGGVALTPYTVLYNGSTTPPVNAGTYPIEVQYAGNANYDPVTATGSFTIDKATPTVTATGGTFTYDAQPHAGSGSAVGVLGETLTPITLTYDGSSSTAPTNAGSHTVRASFAGSSNYNAAQSADASLTINRATATAEFDPAPVWYTGYPRTAIAFVRGIGGVELNPITLRYNGSTTAPTNAGTYALEVQFAGNGNYEPLTATSSFVIKKNFPIFGTYSDFGVTYDGQPHGFSANIIGVQNELLTPVIVTYNGSTTMPVNADVYTVVVRYDGSENYEADSRTLTMTIFKVIPSLTWSPAPPSITYGTPLSSTQLYATSNAAGSFAYTPAAGTVLNAGSHTLTAVFTPADPVNYESRSITQTLVVNKATARPAWNRPANIVYGTPLGVAQLNATAPVPGTFTYSPAGGTVLPAGVNQILNVTFAPDDSANYDGASTGVLITVDKATPAVSWNTPADITYGTPLSGAQLNASANVPGSFEYSPASGTILNAGTQQLLVTFTPDDAVNYASVTANATLVVAKVTPVISWSSAPDVVYGTPLSTNELNATVNVPGTLAYSPALGSVLGAGAHMLSVTFTPNDPANYDGAAASVSLNVTKAASILAWSEPGEVVYGTALSEAQLNATANVPGTFVYSPAAGAILAAGPQPLTVTFTPADAANYDGASAGVLLNVTKANPTINWSNPADIVYGTPLSASQLNATSNVPGTLVYLPAAGAILNSGTQILEVTFTPDDPANYNGATVDVTITVTKAASTIAWASPADIVYGTALSDLQLNATANVAGSFAYSPAFASILGAGPHALSVTFTPSDANNYNSATATVTLNVTKATPVVSWSNPVGITYGTALSSTQLNASANVAGSFAYSPDAGTVLNAGSQTLSVTFTPADSANYTNATGNASIEVAKATPVVTWSNPAGITYGTALSSTQLNASANVAGAFVYSPAAGTALNAGTHTLSVMFTPADSTNYTSTNASVSIAIATRALTVQTDNVTKVYGAALPAFTASGIGFVNGDSMSSLAGVLTFTTSATAASAPGSYSVTPSGVTSANYSIAFANGTLTVTKAATSMTFTTTPNPSNNNQTVQLRAVVSAVAPGAGTATGTVEFRENGTLLGTATLVNGVATFNKNFKRGTHPLTATYAGDANFTGSSGSVNHQTQ